MIDLEQKAKEIRGMILDQVYTFKNGHIASAFSIVEILLHLYHNVMRINPKNPYWHTRDRLIISKGHGVSALYAILADLGFFAKEYLASSQNGSFLGGHADRRVPGIEWSTGSLGHGLSVAAGMALASKINDEDQRIFCILGDGELQEGSIWEAAMFASQHKLNNIIVVVDYNQSQSCGPIKDILNVSPIISKWNAFGWFSVTADGHSFDSLSNSFGYIYRHSGLSPSVIIAYTQKGNGVSFIQDGDKWHTGIPNDDELAAAKVELGI